MPHFLYKMVFKIYEKVLRLRTALLTSGSSDPTEMLLDCLMPPSEPGPVENRGGTPHQLANGNPQKLLVLVPFRDRWEMTKVCLERLLKQEVKDVLVEVVLIDNGSKEAATREGIRTVLDQALKPNFTLHHLKLDAPFNFSYLNNEAVRQFSGPQTRWLLFLNNDVEVIEPNALARFVAFYESKPNIGALGCTLLYPEGRIQHLFAAPGVKIVAAHPLKGVSPDRNWAWFKSPRAVPAVTGAALFVSREKFEDVGMFDERLPIHGQDIDLCLKLQKQDLVNWVLSDCFMTHYESFSRKAVISPIEVDTIYRRWGAFLHRNPALSSKFSRWSEYPVYAWIEQDYPWRRVLPTVRH